MAENQNCSHDCGSCGADCASRTQSPKDFQEAPHELSSIRRVIGVVSGKGGVGKSLVTSMLAVLLNRRGLHTAILDADVTGPSIPRIFGLHERAVASGNAILPVATKTGIDVMSVNLLLEDENAAGGLARPGDCRNRQAVLDRRDLERTWTLPVCRYASGHRRRAVDRLPVPACWMASSWSPRPRSW